MLQRSNFTGVDLAALSLETLEGMADATEAFVFSQQQPGEKFHPDYRRNRKSFKKLIRETVKFKREMGKFFASQYQRITPYISVPGIRADEVPEEDDYLKYIDWDKENQTLTATLEINLGELFTVGAQATELQLQADLNIGPHMTEEAKFLRNTPSSLRERLTRPLRNASPSKSKQVSR